VARPHAPNLAGEACGERCCGSSPRNSCEHRTDAAQGPFTTIKHFYKHLEKSQSGKIINMSSNMGSMGGKSTSAMGCTHPAKNWQTMCEVETLHIKFQRQRSTSSLSTWRETSSEMKLTSLPTRFTLAGYPPRCLGSQAPTTCRKWLTALLRRSSGLALQTMAASWIVMEVTWLSEDSERILVCSDSIYVFIGLSCE
jgi:hypothetical protein